MKSTTNSVIDRHVEHGVNPVPARGVRDDADPVVSAFKGRREYDKGISAGAFEIQLTRRCSRADGHNDIVHRHRLEDPVEERAVQRAATPVARLSEMISALSPPSQTATAAKWTV